MRKTIMALLSVTLLIVTPACVYDKKNKDQKQEQKKKAPAKRSQSKKPARSKKMEMEHEGGMKKESMPMKKKSGY